MKLNGTNRNSFSLSSNKLSSSHSHALNHLPPIKKTKKTKTGVTINSIFLTSLLVMTFPTGKKMAEVISELCWCDKSCTSNKSKFLGYFFLKD